MANRFDTDRKYKFIFEFTSVCIFAIAIFMMLVYAICYIVSYISDKRFALSVSSMICVFFIYIMYRTLLTFNKKIEYIYLCYLYFKPYTKDDINAIYLDESIDIDFIYYKLIPYSEYKNNETIDQHINIDRLLKQRRPLDMKLTDISFSENDMAILL